MSVYELPDCKIITVIISTVYVERESTYRESSRKFRSFYGPLVDPIWITFDQLYDTLAHSEPGHYILRDA